MLRITKQTDYGIMLLAHMASLQPGQIVSARDAADETGISLPMVSKILKALARGNIVEIPPWRGRRLPAGGFARGHDPWPGSSRALEGPISMVECGAQPGQCGQEPTCPVRVNWARVNREVERALERVPITEMVTDEEPCGVRPGDRVRNHRHREREFMSTPDPTVEQLANREYKWGFVTDIEQEIPAAGAERGGRALHLGQEEGARVDARVAAQGLPPLADADRADLAQRRVPEDRLPGHRSITRRPRRPKRRPERASTRSIPRSCATYEKLGIPLHEQKMLAGVAVDAVFDSVSVATTFKDRWPKRESSSARSPRRCVSIPSWCEKYLGSVVPTRRQLLRRAELGGLLRRLVRLHPRRACAARWSCRPTSVSTPRTPDSSSAP